MLGWLHRHRCERSQRHNLWLEETSYVAVPPEHGMRPREFGRCIREEWVPVPEEEEPPEPPRPEVRVSEGFSYPPMPRPDSRRRRRLVRPDQVAFSKVDLSRVITIRRIPEQARDRFKRLVTLANVAGRDELPAALEQLYREAAEMAAANWRDPLHDLHGVPSIFGTVAASSEEHARDLWQRALSSHDAVELEWSETLLDPFAVLEHPMLLDVRQPTTAAFITAYTRAQDFRAVHGRAFDRGHVGQYAELALAAATAWEEAKARAKNVGLRFLPEAEQGLLRRALELLATADDDDLPVPRRVRASRRAAKLLSKVHSMVLPDDAKAVARRSSAGAAMRSAGAPE